MAGCSGPAGPDRAAVVDGQVISETALQTTQAELNALEPNPFQQKLTPQDSLLFLVQAPTLIDSLTAKGVIVSESVAADFAQQRGVQEPGDGTIAVIRSLAALSNAQGSGQWTEQDQAAFTQQLAEQDVVVNPRYGTFEPTAPAISLTTPDWVTPLDPAQ